MNANTTFNIYVMSYKRANAIMTNNVFEYCTYVVREKEEIEYREAGIDNILVIPNEANVYDFMTSLYWIIDNTPEDVIFIADDDIKEMNYRLNDLVPILKSDGTLDKETATAEVERIAQLLVDLNLGLAFDNPQRALYVYDKEISFKGMPGHIRWINKSALKAKLNESDPASSDIDMAMQELLLNRVVLLPKYFISTAKMDLNDGNTETRKNHIELTYALRTKWGRYYEYDYRKNQASINVTR